MRNNNGTRRTRRASRVRASRSRPSCSRIASSGSHLIFSARPSTRDAARIGSRSESAPIADRPSRLHIDASVSRRLPPKAGDKPTGTFAGRRRRVRRSFVRFPINRFRRKGTTAPSVNSRRNRVPAASCPPPSSDASSRNDDASVSRNSRRGRTEDFRGVTFM